MRPSRILAIVLLCSPVLMVVLFAIFYFIPGMSKLVSEIFWKLFDDWTIFDITRELINSMSESPNLNMDGLFVRFVSYVFQSALEAIFMGCCIFLLQSLSVSLGKVKRRGDKWYTFSLSRPKWVLDVAGVCIAVLLDALIGISPKSIGPILKGSASLILLLVGIVLILRSDRGITGKNNGRKTGRNKSGFLLKLLLDILVDAFKAIAVVNLITLVMEGPGMLKAGAYPIPMFIWMVCSVLLMFFLNLLDSQAREL